jgi:hypothetical protein
LVQLVQLVPPGQLELMAQLEHPGHKGLLAQQAILGLQDQLVRQVHKGRKECQVLRVQPVPPVHKGYLEMLVQ